MNTCLGCSSSAETCWIIKCESTWPRTSFQLKDKVVSESGWRLGFSSPGEVCVLVDCCVLLLRDFDTVSVLLFILCPLAPSECDQSFLIGVHNGYTSAVLLYWSRRAYFSLT